MLDRPGAPQTELRIGHVGLPRRTADYFGLQVMVAILGGLFNSRLQKLLRDERGYTYGVTASFDLRRRAGPFAIRTAVQADASGDAVRLTLEELRRIRSEPVTDAELAEAREYLTGSFALRHATSTQVAGAVAELVVQGLPDDELDRYRAGIAAVDAGQVMAAAQHIDPDAVTVLAVGDSGLVEPGLATQFQPIERATA
jgi:zinc protease